MDRQQTFSDIEYGNRKRKTKREEFLAMMEKVVPWEAFVALVHPYYYAGKRGRPPIGIETMLRMYFLQVWFSLSDEKVEDAIYDSYAFRTFMGIDFLKKQAPDATTLCLFRTLLEENALTIEMFDYIKDALDEKGVIMHGGSIVDATIIKASGSTKNAEKKRDPEMGSTKKNGQWHFGAKLHIGTDAGTGLVHDFSTTAANESDISETCQLLRPDDEVAYGDAGYIGVEKREEIQTDYPDVEFRINVKRSSIPIMPDGEREKWAAVIEARKSAVRNKVEHIFHIIKDIFGFRKTPYKGILKLEARLAALCMSANLYICGKFRKMDTPLMCC
jgi:IS5 family transposase